MKAIRYLFATVDSALFTFTVSRAVNLCRRHLLEITVDQLNLHSALKKTAAVLPPTDRRNKSEKHKLVLCVIYNNYIFCFIKRALYVF